MSSKSKLQKPVKAIRRKNRLKRIRQMCLLLFLLCLTFIGYRWLKSRVSSTAFNISDKGDFYIVGKNGIASYLIQMESQLSMMKLRLISI
mgnify:CR=1 FL=1